MTDAMDDLTDALVRSAHLDPALVARPLLAPLVLERRRALRLATDAEYARRALKDAAELSRLRDMVAVPETWLFRYAASMELLREHLQLEGTRSVRMLSIACATGAEPYSISAAALSAGVPREGIRIVAVDPSADALARAKVGSYSRLAARDGVPPWAAPYFESDGEAVRACPELHGAIEWLEATAPKGLEPLADRSFDVVFCRNVAIYLGAEPRRQLGALILECLAPEGILFLGHAEPPSIFGIADHVRAVEPRASFAFERAAASATATRPKEPANARGTAQRVTPELRADSTPRATQRATPTPRAASARGAMPTAATARPAPIVPTLADVRAAADAGKLERALDLGRARLDAGDRSVDLLLLVGTTHAALGEHRLAEDALRRVVYLDATCTDALLQLATLCERRGDDGMATRYRARAAKCAPTPCESTPRAPTQREEAT